MTTDNELDRTIRSWITREAAPAGPGRPRPGDWRGDDAAGARRRAGLRRLERARLRTAGDEWRSRLLRHPHRGRWAGARTAARARRRALGVALGGAPGRLRRGVLQAAARRGQDARSGRRHHDDRSHHGPRPAAGLSRCLGCRGRRRGHRRDGARGRRGRDHRAQPRPAWSSSSPCRWRRTAPRPRIPAVRRA